MNITIVGAGIMGLATAWALGRRGHQVTVIDQGPIPNPRASSYDEHRIIRHVYGTLRGYAAMMPEAYRAWDRLWADLGATHFERTGGVHIMRSDSIWFEATRASLDAMGIPWRILDADEVAQELPMIEPDGILRAIWTQGDGMLFASRILTDLAAHLVRTGCVLMPNRLVTGVDPERGVCELEGERIEADMVVVTAGAWIDRLVPELKERAVASRQHVLYLEPPDDLKAAWSRAPIMLDVGSNIGSYALPPRGGTRLKIGDHVFTGSGDPDDDRQVTADDVAPLYEVARRSWRRFDDYRVTEMKACFYTVEERERFMLLQTGARGWALSACSGHGFKFGTTLGEGLAAAIDGQWSTGDAAAWAAGQHPMASPAVTV